MCNYTKETVYEMRNYTLIPYSKWLHWSSWSHKTIKS